MEGLKKLSMNEHTEDMKASSFLCKLRRLIFRLFAKYPSLQHFDDRVISVHESNSNGILYSECAELPSGKRGNQTKPDIWLHGVSHRNFRCRASSYARIRQLTSQAL